MSKKHSKFAGGCDQTVNVDGRPVYVEDLGDALKILTPDLDSTGKQKFEVVPCEMDEQGKNIKWKKVYAFRTLLLIDGMKTRLTTEELILQEEAADPVQLR